MNDETNPEAQATGKPGDLETIARLACEMATHENARKTRRLEMAAGVAKFMFLIANRRLSALNYAATAADGGSLTCRKNRSTRWTLRPDTGPRTRPQAASAPDAPATRTAKPT